MTAPSVAGHGWVIPRPDGAHVRCGGPALCRDCKAEAEALAERNVEVVWAVRLSPGMVTEDGRTVQWVNGREIGFTDGTVERGVTWLPVCADRARPSRAVEAPSPAAVQSLAEVRSAFLDYQQSTEAARHRWEQTVHSMVEARNAGVSMSRIGQEVGLTRERVRQIINEWDGPPAVPNYSNGGTRK